MIPVSGIEQIDEKEKPIGNKAFSVDFEKKIIGEIIDGKEALKQAIRIALLTQRYKYAVFSHDYGTDFEGAFSDGYVKAMGKVKKAIMDSLLSDDRILSVEKFEFERRGSRMKIRFHVVSNVGSFGYETEVE